MSTLKADTVTTKSDNTDLTITGGGSGVPDLEAGFKVGSVAGVPTASIRDDAVTTAKILNDNVTLAKLAAGTDGELITWDASGDPAAVAVGTATHVLTSNGAGAAPTFQAAGGGAWTFVATSGDLTTESTINFTGISNAYDMYALVTASVGMSGGYQIRFRVSTDGGSSYISASQYRYMYSGQHDGATTYEQSNATTADYLRVSRAVGGINSTEWWHGQGGWNQTTNVDAVQFVASAGTFNTGRATLYGIKHS